MKLISALSTILCLAPSAHAISKTSEDQFHGTKTEHVGNAMWLFGEGGVYVYSPDGRVQKNHIDGSAVCQSKEDFEGPSYMYCRFNDIVSDGKKFVWAALSRGKPTVDVFDIDSGSMVGSFDTCESPSTLEYHPLRDEVWIRCSDVVENGTAQTNLDVISAANPAGDIQTDILLKDRALSEGLSSRGYSVIDNTLGDVGYLTDSELPYLFKMDLSTKNIIKKIDLTPAAHGLYETAYSPINRHIFVRAVMCCTCGFDGADLGDSCGRSDGYDVSPTTGAFAGQINVQGVCGSSCEAKVGIDTVGIYEFDTVSETVVATHQMKEGFGGDPYPSPDGKYIVVLGRNGGKTIQIIEAGENGLASRTLIDLELDFLMTGYEDKSVAKDFAFVYKDGKTCVVFPSGTEHKVAIVELSNGDLTNDNVKVSYVTFNNDEFVVGRAPHGRYRQVEWAVGTDYVWVTDGSLEEVYIIDVMKKNVVNTLTEIDTGRLVSIQNYERVRQFEQQQQLIAEMRVEDSKTMEISAIVVGSFAVAVGIANYMYMMKMKKEFHAEISKDEPKNLIVDVEQSSVTQSEGGLNSIN